MPRIIAMEPGPLVLERGLRLLPNEIPPGLSPPDLLLVSASTEWEPPLVFLAFIRGCLSRDGRVWVVGERFPKALAELGLAPGSLIELISVADLATRLSEAFSSPPAHTQQEQ